MNHPKKLCIITTHPIQYMTPWFRALAEEPLIELTVIFLRELNPVQQGVGFGKVFTWDVPLRQGYDSHVLNISAGIKHLSQTILRLRQTLSNIQPDVVLITGWNELGLVIAYPLTRLLGIPVILRGEANAIRQRNALNRFAHRLLLKFVSAIIIIGKSNRQFYRDNGYPSSRLFDGVYFVESERMVAMADQNMSARSTLRKEYAIEEHEFVFSFVGKHVPFKRPMLLVEAASLLIKRGLPIKLLFAGSGELTENLKKRAHTLNVPIYFTGFLNQTEMWKVYIPADAFVLPSTNGETWGLVTNEAMLFGLPVIVSDQVGCGHDLVIDGETGLRFSGEAEGLANAMELLMKDPEHARQMGAKGKQLVLEKYSMPTATKGLMAAIQAVTTQDSHK